MNRLEKINNKLFDIVDELMTLTNDLMISSDYIDGANNIIRISRNI